MTDEVPHPGRASPAYRCGYVLYTAALPAYRKTCMELVQEALGPAWCAFAGPTLLDKSVKTDLPPNLFTPISNYSWFGGRLLFQWGHWKRVVGASTAILDLNPRSLTAWVLLIGRKALGRRTLVWGHLDPRRGADAPTARLRAFMRDLADGCIVYTYESAARLRRARPMMHVWVAPNALYSRTLLQDPPSNERNLILFVGRLEPPKRPDLLLEAFAAIARKPSNRVLVYIGEGSMASSLSDLAESLGITGAVRFVGEIHDPHELAAWYGQAYCSVSPGYVGLSLTQSLGFGVPMVIARDEPHAPEIELASTPGSAIFFERGSSVDLARALDSPELQLENAERAALVEYVRSRYTAEAMSQGLVEAVTTSNSAVGA